MSAVALAGGLALVREARLGRPTLAIEYARILDNRLPALAKAHGAGQPTVAMLGDSTLVSYPEGRSVPERLQQRVDGFVSSLGIPGAGVFDEYFVADRIAAARPDVVVVAVNLAQFSRMWQRSLSRPELAGFIEPDRLLEALRLPLEWTGLTADQLLATVALVQAGGFDAWFELSLRQAQFGWARERLEVWLQRGDTGKRAKDAPDDTPERHFRSAAKRRSLDLLFTAPDLREYRAAGIREHYGASLAGVGEDHPVLQVLGATVARLRRGDIRVLAYVVPLDVSRIDALGLLDRDGLGRTLAAIEATVVRRGGTFADLHDHLPAGSFRDAPGHLAWEGDVDGPSQLADALAPRVRAALLGDPTGGS